MWRAEMPFYPLGRAACRTSGRITAHPAIYPVTVRGQEVETFSKKPCEIRADGTRSVANHSKTPPSAISPWAGSVEGRVNQRLSHGDHSEKTAKLVRT